MFFIAYLVHELSRRRARTLTALVRIGIATGLVISVTAVGDGVNATQSQVLTPLFRRPRQGHSLHSRFAEDQLPAPVPASVDSHDPLGAPYSL